MTETIRFTIGGKTLSAPIDQVRDYAKKLSSHATLMDKQSAMVRNQRAGVTVKLQGKSFTMTTDEVRRTARGMRAAVKSAENAVIVPLAPRKLFDGGWITKQDVETVIRNSRPYAPNRETAVNRENAERLWSWMRQHIVAKGKLAEYCTKCGTVLDKLLRCKCGVHDPKAWLDLEGFRVDEFVTVMSTDQSWLRLRQGSVKDNVEELLEAAERHLKAS